MELFSIFCRLWLVLTVCYIRIADSSFLIGRGIADITGLAADGALYGYADPAQEARGLHSRQFSRSFIFADVTTPENRVVLVVAEIALVSQALKTEVIERLEEAYGSQYSAENVMISATHSHSTPGGHNTYWMYTVPTGGYINETVKAYADGIFESIQEAHDSLAQGQVLMNIGELLDASVSRSGYAYDQNPEEERARYEYNVDKEMTVLKLVADTAEEFGMISLFPVHTTSMKRTNHLISTDNKGYASQMFERQLNPGAFPGNASILGAFAQTSEGDASPNLLGALCDVTLEPCSYDRSTCPADPTDPALCNSYGPNMEEFADTKLIGERQYLKAMELYDNAETALSGSVSFRHMWVNMSDVYLGENENGSITTCRPAMGYGFAAGATDGPGVSPFTQGELEYIPAVDRLVRAIHNYSDEMVECHYPKPILLPTGELENPRPWQPEIIGLQLFQIGSLYLMGSPVEVTTMAGRRLQERVEQVLSDNGAPVDRVVSMALTNGFTSYLTTKEEYQVQRYEGASNTYGPNTLDAYLMVFSELATAMAAGEPVEPGEGPPDLRGFARPALDPVVIDDTLDDFKYGDVLEDTDDIYVQGDSVSAVFLAGNPRNNHMTGTPFLEIQHQDGENWETVLNDAHWETKMYWDSSCHDVSLPGVQGCDESQQSNATVVWDIAMDQQVGMYRIAHYGQALTESGLQVYEGYSSSFEVMAEEEL